MRSRRVRKLSTRGGFMSGSGLCRWGRTDYRTGRSFRVGAPVGAPKRPTEQTSAMAEYDQRLRRDLVVALGQNDIGWVRGTEWSCRRTACLSGEATRGRGVTIAQAATRPAAWPIDIHAGGAQRKLENI